jgi:hypothetical protein
MPSPEQQSQIDARQAKEIGERLRELLGNESVTDFSRRVGVSRQWLHDILSGRVSREASLATMSSIGDTIGYSWEWLVTGKGMPNQQFHERTTLLRRLIPKTSARKKISLVPVEGEWFLVQTSFLERFEGDVHDLGALGGRNVDLGPIVGNSGEVLVDLKDQTLVHEGLFLAQIEDRLLACRAIKAGSVWILTSAEHLMTPESLIGNYRILGRIRFVCKHL